MPHKPLDLAMKSHFVLIFLVIVTAMVPCLLSQKAHAIEVFVNGEEFSSFKDYQDKKTADEKRAAAGITTEPLKATSSSTKMSEPPLTNKGLPFTFDPAKGKTVIISQDGSVREEKGVTALPDWMVFDSAKGKTIDIKAVPEPDQGVISEATAGQPLADTAQSPEIVDTGRIAGVQPSLAQVVEQFQTSKGARTAQRVSSSLELEEGLRKALQRTDGVVLLIAGPDKVRLYDLRGPEAVGDATDGQKTR
jgi:hypothetical protein